MKKAVVVLSGGQDSATCAAWATTMFDEVKAISFDYGQKHGKELESAKKIAELHGMEWEMVEVAVLKNNPASALTDDSLSVNDVNPHTGLPYSFVPGRNIVFLSAASSWALSRGISNIVTGVCQTDYSGYPDCRRVTIDAMEKAIYMGNEEVLKGLGETKFHIHTPLMYLTKAETVNLAQRLPKGMETVGLSWTCYEGGETPCGECPACKLRIAGFEEAGVVDPAL